MERIDTRLAALEKSGGDPVKPVGSASPPPSVTRPWMLSANAIASLPQAVQRTLSDAGIDLSTQSLPVMMNALHAERVEQLMVIERAKIPSNSVMTQVGSVFTHAASAGQ